MGTKCLLYHLMIIRNGAIEIIKLTAELESESCLSYPRAFESFLFGSGQVQVGFSLLLKFSGSSLRLDSCCER